MGESRVSTGINELDAILDGGLLRHQNALLRGPPGAGKTIFGLHFLSDGTENDETSLFINLGEPDKYGKDTAAYFDLNPDAITFHDLSPSAAEFDDSETYTLFSSAEVEQPSFIENLRDVITVSGTVSDPAFARHEDRFLLDARRLLVAISRSRYLTVVVASSALFEVAPRDPDQLADGPVWARLFALVAGSDDPQPAWEGSLGEFSHLAVNDPSISIEVY